VAKASTGAFVNTVAQCFLHQLGHVRIQHRHNLLASLDECGRQAAGTECLGDLDADVATTDHGRSLRSLSSEPVDERLRLLDTVQRENTGGVSTRDSEFTRARTSGQHELIERLAILAPLLVVQRDHLAASEIEPDDLGAQPHIDAVAAMCFRCASDELAPLCDVPCDVIWQPAERVRGERTAFESDDLDVGAHPSYL
jgi:hypothetical protein